VTSQSDGSPLLSNRCRLPQRSLWFGRALLYEDRVRIRGWTWRGRYERAIRLERIERVQWWAVVDDVNFMLHLEDGGAVPLQLLKGAGTWNVTLHDLLGQSLMAHHSPSDVQPSNKAASPSS
jgi:hypothetical protein